MDDRPWPEWSNGKPISQTALARQLKGFKIKPKSIRFGTKTYSGYERDWLKDALKRYPAPDEVQQVQQSNNGADKPANSNRDKTPNVVVSKTLETPHKTTTVAGVVDGPNGMAPTSASTGELELNLPSSEEAEYTDQLEREAIQNDELQ